MTHENGIDLAVIAAHPDDAELNVGGILARTKRLGHRTAVIDLTRGELSSRGTLESRATETARATEILGLDARVQLELPDGEVRDTHEARERLVRAIRDLRPKVLLAPWRDDLHPDHAGAGELAWRALYPSGITKFAGGEGAPWRPRLFGYYPGHIYVTPAVIVDVTEDWDTKIEAGRAYRTQFDSAVQPEGPPTKISQPGFMASVEGRAREFGNLVGTTFGEGVVWRELPPLVDDLVAMATSTGLY